MMVPPQKPFPDYKWRWASHEPTESLLDPAVFFGVLRAMRACEGQPKNSVAFYESLRRIEGDLASTPGLRLPSLARDQNRNLLRNSGQYWQGLALMERTPGIIRLTDFGRKVADGLVARDEFAAAIVRTLTLPNDNAGDNGAAWREAGVCIRPLQVILKVMLALCDHAPYGAYLTVGELIRIIIPLAGVGADESGIAAAIVEHRAGRLSLVGWPDCAPKANDARSAHEFLRFLYQYGYCSENRISPRTEWRYALNIEAREEIQAVLNVAISTQDPSVAVESLQTADAPMFVERSKRLVEMVSRSAQPVFRRLVLQHSATRCVITGDNIPEVLQAAHIVPVRYNGTDEPSNGLCMRADIHLLFDAGHLRLNSTGEVSTSDRLRSSPSYARLPSTVVLPAYVSSRSIEWRWNYK